jgi:hypothetical protein
MSEPITEAPVVEVAPEPIDPPQSEMFAAQEPPDEPAMFDAAYVKELREENAAHRVKAKRVDDANARLVASYVDQDGRVVADDVLPYSDDLLDEHGLVDRERVTAALDELLALKPYLRSRRPTNPLPQGVREDVPEEVGLFGLMTGR